MGRGITSRITGLLGKSMPDIVAGIVVAIILGVTSLLYSGFVNFITPAAPSAMPAITPTAVPPVTEEVAITTIFYDGEGRFEADEYVEIMNEGMTPIQLLGWTLADKEQHRFIFPAYLIQPGERCRVYTNESHEEWGALSYGSGSAIWNNGGDTAMLHNSRGEYIDACQYSGGEMVTSCQ